MSYAAPLEKVDGGFDVGGPVPAEGVRASAARAASALVVQQDAVAVAREQPRVQLEAVAVAAAAVDEDDRGAVPRGYVPRGEPHAVGRATADVLLRDREGTHGHARLAGDPERGTDRLDDQVTDENRHAERRGPADDATSAGHARLAPQGNDRRGKQRATARDEREAGHLLRGEAVPAHIEDRDERADEGQRTGGERERGADRRPQEAVAEPEEDEEREPEPLALLDEAERDQPGARCGEAGLERGNGDAEPAGGGERRGELGHAGT